MSRAHLTHAGGAPGRVVVVGAGLAGLAAALHLRGMGVQVTVLDRGPAPGGLAAPAELAAATGGRYLLDTGPTVLTMPDLLERPFAAVGQRMGDRLSLRRLDPAYRAEFADGTGLSLAADLPTTLARVAELAGEREADGFARYLDRVAGLLRLELDRFIDRNTGSPLDLLGPELVRLVASGGFRRLGRAVRRYVSDARLQRVLTFQALYAGVAPARALSLYGVITAMDLLEGVYYPQGGMSAVPLALAAAARAAGVELEPGVRVTGVTRRGRAGGHGLSTGRVDGVTGADGRRWRCDALVLACDPDLARYLLGHPPPLRQGVRSPSCVVLAAGLDRPLRSPGDGAAHHTIRFGRAWDAVFDDLAGGRLMRDPSFLLSLPTVSDPSLAPPGRGLAYLLFPAPHLQHDRPLDWPRLRGPYREEMLAAAARAGVDLAGAVDAELLTTPADWAERGYPAGTPFALAHTLAQTGPLRTGNLAEPNVALAGGGTVPGVGVPMVLISGRLAAQRLTGAAA